MVTQTSAMAVIRASQPSFRNPHDKIAFALHSSFLAAGYALTATGMRAYAEEVLPASTSGQSEVGIDGWNEFDDSYGFVYFKEERGSKTTALVKCLTIDDKLVIDVLCCDIEQKEPLHLEINVDDYVSTDGGGSTNYSNIYKNFGVLVESFNSSLLLKLEDKSRNTTTSRSSPTQTSGGTERSQNPPKEPFAGEARGGMSSGGSMLLGPNDPRWYGIGTEQPEFIPGISGGPFPPGARFDPYGPPGIPGFEPNRFIRNPSRRPGSDAHPDLQHFRGPGFPDYT